MIEHESDDCQWCHERPSIGLYGDTEGQLHAICRVCACGLRAPDFVESMEENSNG
jgi:hypothetical protein